VETSNKEIFKFEEKNKEKISLEGLKNLKDCIFFYSFMCRMKSVKTDDAHLWLKEQWPGIRFGYEDKDIFNGDEAGLFYNYMPNKTLRPKNKICSAKTP
jgi:hypothetical protein